MEYDQNTVYATLLVNGLPWGITVDLEDKIHEALKSKAFAGPKIRLISKIEGKFTTEELKMLLTPFLYASTKISIIRCIRRCSDLNLPEAKNLVLSWPESSRPDPE